MAHWVSWFGAKNHLSPDYRSYSPETIKRQLDCMQALEIDGVVALWGGSTIEVGSHAAVIEMAFQTNARGMLFALCVNNSLVKFRPVQSVPADVEVITQMANPDIQELLTLSNYVPGGYVLEFGVFSQIADAGQSIRAATPGLQWLSQPKGYTWPQPLAADPIATLRQQNADNQPVFSAVFSEFNDSKRGDLQHQVWDTTQPARIIEPRGGHTWHDSIAAACPTSLYLQIVTWNDYEERTAIEAGASMATGIRI